MLQLLLLGLLSQSADAGVITAREPLITAAPVLKERAVTTAGYYSTGEESGTTLWGTVTFDAEGQVVATSGDQFQICASDGCVFHSCTADYWVDSTTSSYCGTSSGLTCSYNRLYTDISDQSPLTNYWCDTMTETGYEVYQVTPTPASSPSSIVSVTTTPSSSASTSHSSSSSTTPTPTPTPSPPPENKKSTPVGAIVGGVIGGLAVIGAIVVGIIFLMKRNKKPAATNPSYQAVPPPGPAQGGQYPPSQFPQSPQPYQAYPEMGMAAAPLPEKTPAATSQNVQTYYAPEGPASPVPQYSTNNGAVMELPAQRM